MFFSCNSGIIYETEHYYAERSILLDEESNNYWIETTIWKKGYDGGSVCSMRSENILVEYVIELSEKQRQWAINKINKLERKYK